MLNLLTFYKLRTLQESLGVLIFECAGISTRTIWVEIYFNIYLTFNIDLTFYMLQISQYRFKTIVIPSTVSSLLFTFPTYSLLFYFLSWFLQSCVCLFIFLFNIQRNGRENRQKSIIHWFTLQLPAVGRYSKWGARHSVCLPCRWQDWTTRTITFFLFMNRKLPE